MALRSRSINARRESRARVTVPVCPGGVLVVSTTTSTERTRVTGGGPLASSIGRKPVIGTTCVETSGPITSERYHRREACPPSGSRSWIDTRIGRSADNRRRSHAAQLSPPTSDETSAAYWLARAPGASA